MANIKAAMKSQAAKPGANAARSNLPVPAKPAAKPKLPHRYGEKRTIAGVVSFIISLVIIGVIYSYSGVSTGPQMPPATEATQQAPTPMRIARILLPGTGAQCREILFDNDTGYFSLEKSVPCGSAPSAQAKVGSGNNLGIGGGGSGGGGFSSFKEAFGRKS